MATIPGVGEDMNIDPVGLEFYPQDGLDPHSNISEEIEAAMLGTVAKVPSAVLRSQAGSSVMGSLIVHYIAWLSNVPLSGGGSVNQSLHYVGILEMLEIQVREICDTNQSRSRSALKNLVAALQAVPPPGGVTAAGLENLEDEIKKEAAEGAEFF